MSISKQALSRLLMIAIAFAVCSPVIGQETDEKEKVDIASLMDKGQGLIQAQQWAKAAETFQKVVEEDDGNALGWQLLGYALHSDGKLDEAIKAHTKATNFPTMKSTALYNLGCAYSLKKDNEKSLVFLNKALDAGFDRLDMFSTDADLVNVRKADGYKMIKMRLDNGGKMPEVKIDMKDLAGKWKVLSGVRAGEEVAKERLPMITIDKENITIPAGPDAFVMGYTIDHSKKPATIDLKMKSGPAPEGSAAVGLIKAEKGKLFLCYNAMGTERPAKFESTEDNGFFMFKMELGEKAKAEKAEAKEEKSKEEKSEEKEDDDDEDEDDDDDDDDGN